MAIYITGDIHGNPERLSNKKLKPFEPFCQSVPFRPLTPYPPFCPFNRMSWGVSWKDFINIDLGVI